MLQTFNVPALGRQIDAKANFFRYESSGVAGADETVRVRAGGNDLGSYLPGDSIELPDAVSRWEITPLSGTQTCIVRLGLGRVSTARLVGNVRVIDQISPNARTDSASSTGVTAFSATQILAPGANVAGAVVRAALCEVKSGAGGTSVSLLIAAKVVPTGSQGTEQMTLCRATDSDAAYKQVSNFQLSRAIPAGWGIWFCNVNTAVAAANNAASISWELS